MFLTGRPLAGTSRHHHKTVTYHRDLKRITGSGQVTLDLSEMLMGVDENVHSLVKGEGCATQKFYKRGRDPTALRNSHNSFSPPVTSSTISIGPKRALHQP